MTTAEPSKVYHAGISFIPLFEWAILPAIEKVDHESARQRSEIYKNHFKYLRADRLPEFCPSWVRAQQFGWRVYSPVDILLSPIEQIEIDPGKEQDAALRAMAKNELWLRNKTALAVERTSWLHLYQYRNDDHWESMFIPNGGNSVEWRLGWNVVGFQDCSMLIFPSERSHNIGVETGILSSPTLSNMDRHGLSIAIAPREPVQIRRGQEIARIALLRPECRDGRSIA